MARGRAVPVRIVVRRVSRLLVLEAVVQTGPGYLLAGLCLLLHVGVLLLVRETVVCGRCRSGAAAALLVAEVEAEACSLLLPLADDDLPGVVGLLQAVQPVVHSVRGVIGLRLADLDLGIKAGLVCVHGVLGLFLRVPPGPADHDDDDCEDDDEDSSSGGGNGEDGVGVEQPGLTAQPEGGGGHRAGLGAGDDLLYHHTHEVTHGTSVPGLIVGDDGVIEDLVSPRQASGRVLE